MKHRNIIIFILVAIFVGVIIYLPFRKYTPGVNSDQPKAEDKPIVVAAVGDMTCPPAKPVTDTTCQMAAVAQGIQAINPDAILLLGDIQYDNGELTNFQNVFAGLWNGTPPFYPAPGNHEYNTPGATGYYNYFPNFLGQNNNGYYSFDLGTWKAYALNSNCKDVGGCGESSEQAKWLESELSSSQNRCSLAYWHHPRFTSGPHNDSDSTLRGEYFWQLLYDHRADIVLAGHDHLYERFAKQSADGTADALNGIRQFTVGSGGKSLYEFKNILPTSEFRDNKTFGFLKLELYKTSFAWQFINTDGQVLDSGTNTCSQNY